MKQIKDLSISKKWVFTVYCVGFFATILILMLLTGMKSSRKDLQVFLKGSYSMEQEVQYTTIDILKIAKNIRDLYIQSENQDNRLLQEGITEDIKAIEQHVEILANYLEGTQIPLEEYKNSINEWLNIGNRIISEIELGNGEQAEKLIRYDCPEAIEEVLSISEEITSKINEFVEDSIKSNIKRNSSLSLFSIVIFSIAFAISFILSRKMRASMLTPIEEIKDVAEKMKQGEYGVSISYESKDELGELAQSMREMIAITDHILKDTSSILNNIAQGDLTHKPEAEYIGIFKLIEDSLLKISYQMSDMIKQIGHSAQDVSQGAEEIAEGATLLAQKVVEQEEIIDLFIESTNEVSANIKQSIDKVKKTSGIAVHTKEKATQGSEMMKKMLVSMDEISESSKNISDITKIIDAIAKQTNLLALNAAIEAARAGESGRGFAVVASEIRDLANKSSETVKEIEKVIDESLLRVTQGEEIVQRTAEVLTEVVNSIDETSLVSQELEDSTYIQKELLDHLLVNSERLKVALEGNVQISQESAAISQELAAQSESLKQQIANFKIN